MLTKDDLPFETLCPLWFRKKAFPQRTQGFTEGHSGKSWPSYWDLFSPLLFASFRPRRHGRCLRMMTHIGSQNPENYVLGNVGSVVRDAFQVAGHQERIYCLLSHLRLFVHLSHHHNKSFILHTVDDVIHFQNSLGEFCFAFHERLQCAPHHGAYRGRHPTDIDRQLDGWQFNHVHDALGDVYSLIAHALEIGVDLGHRENEAQIRGRRLLRGEDVESELIDLALGGVDEALVFEDELAAGEIAFGVCLAGAIHRQFRETAHAEQFLPEALHLLLKARAHYPNLFRRVRG